MFQQKQKLILERNKLLDGPPVKMAGYFSVNIHFMELRFFINLFNYYDDEKRNSIENHFGLDRLFTQDGLKEFIKTLPEQYNSYVLEHFDDVLKFESGATEISFFDKRVVVEQKAFVEFEGIGEQEMREVFVVTFDYDSLYDVIQSLV